MTRSGSSVTETWADQLGSEAQWQGCDPATTASPASSPAAQAVLGWQRGLVDVDEGQRQDLQADRLVRRREKGGEAARQVAQRRVFEIRAHGAEVAEHAREGHAVQVLPQHRFKQVLVAVFAFGHDRRRHRGADDLLAGVGQVPASASCGILSLLRVRR